MAQYLFLAIDQGTTSSRAIVFDSRGEVVASSSLEFKQYFPRDGWVEHDPEDIWQTTLQVCRDVLDQVNSGGASIEAIGIANQRETTLLWNRETGECVHKAIVWQDRRTADRCQQLREEGYERLVEQKAGLVIDPYFSGTKLAWLLQHVEGARREAEQGKLAFGTVDSFLLWRLTGGKAHLTDATNASRTMLLNLESGAWDAELLSMLDVPAAVLPEVRDSAAEFGVCDPQLLGRPIPIRGMAGDQQAALIGQACLAPGMAKSTYGTGCFLVANVGDEVIASRHRLLSTIGYQLEGRRTYAKEGAIFNAGSAVQWVRDRLGWVAEASETEAMAASLDQNHGVYLVPAFTGLGAPYWDADARGGIFGLTRDTGPAEIVRATLESVAYQTHDLLEAMRQDGAQLHQLRVDGGMCRNEWLMQFLADVSGIEVLRAGTTEATAWGAAALAALQSGRIDSLQSLADVWKLDRTFTPKMPEQQRQTLLAGWRDTVSRVRGR